ncbi:MAG: hypothetical protein ABFS43_12275 [Thermodesulfobacteriota bacterium]
MNFIIKLKDEALEKGGKLLYERLKVCDPESVARIHVNDTYRIVRALEVIKTAEDPFPTFKRPTVSKSSMPTPLKSGCICKRGRSTTASTVVWHHD